MPNVVRHSPPNAPSSARAAPGAITVRRNPPTIHWCRIAILPDGPAPPCTGRPEFGTPIITCELGRPALLNWNPSSRQLLALNGMAFVDAGEERELSSQTALLVVQ